MVTTMSLLAAHVRLHGAVVSEGDAPTPPTAEADRAWLVEQQSPSGAWVLFGAFPSRGRALQRANWLRAQFPDREARVRPGEC